MNNDTPADAITVLPCPNPWCDAEERDGDFSPQVYRTHFGNWQVSCTSCAQKGPVATNEPAAIKEWNTRTTSLAAQEVSVSEEYARAKSAWEAIAEDDEEATFEWALEFGDTVLHLASLSAAPSLAAQDGLVEALRVIAVGEGCMNGIREELSAAALRKIARAALASIEVKS